MKYFIRLLKNWKAPDGKDFTAGQIIEIDDKALAASLILDEIGVKDVSKVIGQEDMTKAVGEIVTKAINDAVKDMPVQTAKAIHAISVKDLSDDDPTHGYLPPHADGRKHSKDELTYAMGLFAADVYRAGLQGGRVPERLAKSMERSRNVLTKAMNDGIIEKTAGTGMTVADDESAGALIPPEMNTMLLDTAAETAIIAAQGPMSTAMSVAPTAWPVVPPGRGTLNIMMAKEKAEKMERTGIIRWLRTLFNLWLA